MYAKFKSLARTIIPNKLLFQNEEFFRFFHGIWYSGNTYQCNICNHKISTFLKVFGKKQQCPFCGSLARSRRLYHVLEEEVGLSGTVLDFSPPRCLYRKLKKNKAIEYYSTDYENEFLADYRYDITDIPIADNFFDRIICYHVLEHIHDDHKAMTELYRVLKPGGTLLIQTPFKDGEIYEDSSITTTEERLKHFGQEDHVRIYSVAGLVARLKKSGFSTVETRNYATNDIFSKKHGFEISETIIMVSK